MASSEDPDEMPLFAKTKSIFRERNIILFENYDLLPFNACVYNGLS